MGTSGQTIARLWGRYPGFGLRSRLAVLIVVVAVVPAAVLGTTLLDVHERVIDESANEQDRRAAEDGAARVAAAVHGVIRTAELLAVDTVRWDRLSAEERVGALWLIYGHSKDIAAVALTGPDAASASIVHLPAAPTNTRPVPSAALLDAFGAPPTPAGSAASVAAAFFDASAAAAIIPIEIPIALKEPTVVRVALSLANVCAEVARRQSGAIELALIDEQGRRMCKGGGAAVGMMMPAPLLSAIRNDDVAAYAGPSGETLVARAPADFGWLVVATQPTHSAYATSRWMRQHTQFWLAASILAALAAGVVLAHMISKPVGELVEGTVALASGRLDHRVTVGAGGELGRLAHAFNDMGEQLSARDAEIREWNAELLSRVEARSRELTQAYRQVVDAGRMAAVRTLGAGVAHEINNPLTGVLTLNEILLEEAQADPDRDDLVEPLTEIVQSAYRIRDTVRRLAQLGTQFTGEPLEQLDISEVVESSLTLLSSEIEAGDVHVMRTYADGVDLVLGDRGALRQVFVEILKNALESMGRGGSLSVGIQSASDGSARISIADVGRGIEPQRVANIFDPFHTSKANWNAQGLGLAITHRIVDNHGGTVTASSEVAVGTVVVVSLPAHQDSARSFRSQNAEREEARAC